MDILSWCGLRNLYLLFYWCSTGKTHVSTTKMAAGIRFAAQFWGEHYHRQGALMLEGIAQYFRKYDYYDTMKQWGKNIKLFILCLSVQSKGWMNIVWLAKHRKQPGPVGPENTMPLGPLTNALPCLPSVCRLKTVKRNIAALRSVTCRKCWWAAAVRSPTV